MFFDREHTLSSLMIDLLYKAFQGWRRIILLIMGYFCTELSWHKYQETGLPNNANF